MTTKSRLALLALIGSSLALPVTGCGSDGDADKAYPKNSCAQATSANCIEIPAGDAAQLIEVANSLEPDTTVILAKGEYRLSNAVTIRQQGVRIIGQGIDQTILDFADTAAQANGIDVTQSDRFLVQDLTVRDAKKDGIRVESSDGVVFRRIKATWSTPGRTTNGAYGIYPVKSRNVLVEFSEAEHASDAGLYVGQCLYVIVRNNIVRDNVAGLEIENTQYADVYENLAENNTGGIVVFDLPGNPIVGRDVRVRNNIIRSNNHRNFAQAGTTVALIPSGTGTFAMASRRVEITNNTYEDNATVDIALISGLIVDADPALWSLTEDSLIGDWEGLDLLVGAGEGTRSNYRTENIVVANNTHTGGGTRPLAGGLSNPFSQLLFVAYPTSAGRNVDSILYDGLGDAGFENDDAVTNVNHICAGENTNGTFANFWYEPNQASTTAGLVVPFYLPEAPFAPYDCTALNGGPVADVTLSNIQGL